MSDQSATEVRIGLRPVDAARDAAVLHRWVSQERAAFWGMGECTRQRVTEIYDWIVAQDHLEALLILLDDAPVGVLQTYDPSVDEIGAFYDRAPGDLGIHLLLSDDPARRGHTRELVRWLLAHIFGREDVQRLVFEPDARNEQSRAMVERVGAEPGPLVRLQTSVADKPAQFYFLTRERWTALTSAAAEHARPRHHPADEGHAVG